MRDPAGQTEHARPTVPATGLDFVRAVAGGG